MTNVETIKHLEVIGEIRDNAGDSWDFFGFRAGKPLLALTGSEDEPEEMDFVEADASGASYLSENGVVAVFKDTLENIFADDKSADEFAEFMTDESETVEEDEAESEEFSEVIIPTTIDDSEINLPEIESEFTDDEPASKNEEPEHATLEDVIDEIKTEVFSSLDEKITMAVNAATASMDRVAASESADLPLAAKQTIDYVLEQISGLVTARSIKRGEAARDCISVMVHEISKVKGEPFRCGGINPKIIDNPDLWEVSHMIEISKALLANYVFDYMSFKSIRDDNENYRTEIESLRTQLANARTDLKIAVRNSTRDDNQVPTTELDALRTINERLRAQLVEAKSVKHLGTAKNFYIYDPVHGFAHTNEDASRIWWSHNIIGPDADGEALATFRDAPSASRAAGLFAKAAQTKKKDIQAYIVTLNFDPVMATPLVATGKYLGDNSAKPAENIGEVIEVEEVETLEEEILEGEEAEDEAEESGDENDYVQERDFSQGGEMEEDEEEISEEEEDIPVKPSIINRRSLRTVSNKAEPVETKSVKIPLKSGRNIRGPKMKLRTR